MTLNLQDLTHALLDAAKTAGADSADAISLKGTSVSIDVRKGALEQAERSEGTDIGLRVMIGQRQATVSASDTSAATIKTLGERAVAMAQEAPEDPYIGLATPDQLAKSWDIEALELADRTAEPSPDQLQQDAIEAEATALSVNGITQVSASSASYGERQMHIAATNGFSGGYSRTDRGTSCVAIAGEGLGMERDYDSDVRIFQNDLRAPSEIGERAAKRAVERLNARKPSTGQYPVLFDERISGSLIGHLLGASNGAAIARGSSWLKDCEGKQVLSKSLSVYEDPFRARVSGSRPFDAEGLPTAQRTIVENGVLTGWTLDLANARKLGKVSTGNAARGTSSGPSPSNWNVSLSQSDQTKAGLLRDMGTGLLVTSLIGSTINPNTGDYSRGAAGFWVENGEICYPVNECTIAGNLRDMLLTMQAANDARGWLSRVVPSLLVEGLAIAGDA